MVAIFMTQVAPYSSYYENKFKQMIYQRSNNSEEKKYYNETKGSPFLSPRSLMDILLLTIPLVF